MIRLHIRAFFAFLRSIADSANDLFFWKKNHGVASPKSKDFLCGLYWLFSFLFFIEQMVDLYRIYAESQSGFSKLKSFFRIHNI